MGILDAKPTVADVIGVPVYFIQETVLQDLGDGVVRVAGCILQNGVYVPQYYSIMSYATLRRCAGRNSATVGELLDTRMRDRPHH